MSLTLPYISIKPGYFTLFRLPLESRTSKDLSDEARINLSKRSPNGIISLKARRRISAAVDWMLYLALDKRFYSPKHKQHFRFKLNFVTLTLASEQIHPDNVIKSKLLNQFLIEMKRDYNVDNYMWRAEAQQNGNIHFHLITDRFIPWSALRKSWNRIQEKLGYVSRYREAMQNFHKGGFKSRPSLFSTWSLQQQKRAYKSGMKGNWSNPNSTDIHSIHKIKNLSAYVSKYMAKETDYTLKPIKSKDIPVTSSSGERSVFTVTCVERVPLYRPIEGKLWGLSTKLSRLKSVVLLLSGQLVDEVNSLWYKHSGKFKVKDFYSVLYVKMEKWLNATVPCLRSAFKYQLSQIISGESETQVLRSSFDLPPPPPQASPQPVQLSLSLKGSLAFAI